MKKLFALLVLGSLAVIGCEKPAATNKPKSVPASATTGASDADKAKGEAMAKEAGAKAKADAEKAKADADKKTPEPAKVDPKADPKKDK